MHTYAAVILAQAMRNPSHSVQNQKPSPHISLYTLRWKACTHPAAPSALQVHDSNGAILHMPTDLTGFFQSHPLGRSQVHWQVVGQSHKGLFD
eukprot:scaffold135032_cov21-Tisochrysis_lutea.AAC.1